MLDLEAGYESVRKAMMRRFLTIAALLSVITGLSTWVAVAAPLGQQECVITSPKPNAQLRGSVNVVGTARLGPAFDYYKVEYASATTPDAWVTIGDVHSRERTNERLETFHTTSLPDGAYYLHLVIVKTDGSLVESQRVPVEIANRQPSASPTPEETPTPTPTVVVPTPTRAIVELPTVVSRTPSPTTESGATPTSTPEGRTAISFPDLGVFVRQFVFGAFVTTVIFLFVGVVMLLRRVV